MATIKPTVLMYKDYSPQKEPLSGSGGEYGILQKQKDLEKRIGEIEIMLAYYKDRISLLDYRLKRAQFFGDWAMLFAILGLCTNALIFFMYL